MIEIHNLTKRFEDIKAVDEVSVAIWADRYQRCGKEYGASYDSRRTKT